MTPFFLVLALVVQSAFSAEKALKTAKPSAAKEFAASFDTEEEPTRAVLKQEPLAADDVPGAEGEWMDVFNTEHIQPSSAAAVMAKMLTETPPDTQLETIKEMTKKMSSGVEFDLVSLIASLASVSKEPSIDSNDTRKKRSAESPMDSSQLVMRLLKHIKSNNENQNIAIEKMMTAQEIADKYNIPFNPDPDVLTDLATATTDNAKELSEIVADAVSASTAASEVPQVPAGQDDTYYIYSVYPEVQQEILFEAIPIFEFLPEQLPQQHLPVQNVPQNYFNPMDAPMPHPHPHHHHQHNQPAVSPKPTFYDTVVPFPDSAPFSPMEPLTIILPIEEVKPEPELVGEEFEEIISSKVAIEPEAEPGSATVSHVTTYTLSEKAHFRTPHIEKMPEQMQYTFFLM